MESQKRLLDQSSSNSFSKKMKMGDSFIGEELITSSDLDIFATYQHQDEAPADLTLCRKKRQFEDSHVHQHNKRSKSCSSFTPGCPRYNSIDETFKTSRDIDVCGTFKPKEMTTTRLESYNTENMRKSFQSLSLNTSDETQISQDIETCGIYQQSAHKDFNAKAVDRLFHGIEAMASLDQSEFNSLEMTTGNTMIPDDNVSEQYHRNFLWTTAHDEPENVTEFKSLDYTEEDIDSYLAIESINLSNLTYISIKDDVDTDLDSYKYGSCYVSQQYHRDFLWTTAYDEPLDYTEELIDIESIIPSNLIYISTSVDHATVGSLSSQI